MTSDSTEKLDIIQLGVRNHQNSCLPRVSVQNGFGDYQVKEIVETDSIDELDNLKKNSFVHICERDASMDVQANCLDKSLQLRCHEDPGQSDCMSVKLITDESTNQCSTEAAINAANYKYSCTDKINKQDKTCSQCQMTFKYKRHLGRHLEGHQKNNCSHCNAKFARRKHLEVHLFQIHGERVTKYPYTCDVCPRSFLKKVFLNRHRAKHHYENGKVCSECGEMLSSDVDDKEHKEKQCIKKPFQCQRCFQTFSTEQTYHVHLQNHDNYKCSECDMSFASKKKLQEHHRDVHSGKLESTKTISNEIYSCEECNQIFSKKEEYTRHLESTMHQSKDVEETYTKTTFPCSLCSKKLISQRALVQHIRRTHRGEKRFLCNIYDCIFQCSRKTDLDRHKQLHVEQRNVVCEHCGKTFTSVSILNDHVLYVHNKERQFVCEECGKAFKRNSLLKRHKLSHQQHRPFACMECSTAFKRSHHLTRHLETCHKIILERKQKVLKLMKTDDGKLVPVPEQPRRLKCHKTLNTKQITISSGKSEKLQLHNTNAVPESTDLHVPPLFHSNNRVNSCSNSSQDFRNALETDELAPQLLSVVNINSGQVVTVEVTSPETLGMNDLVDQFEMSCHEMPSLSDYNDLEFQSGILNTDQNYYDHNSYSELPLENVEGTSLLLDSSINKIDILPTIENYLSQPFSAFLNL